MLQLSSALLKKAITLFSTTIDSPTNRTNDKGEAIRPTIYFDKPVKQDGKNVPGKKSTLYTPDKDEAKALKATCDSCECVCLDGSGKYDPDNELHYRFLKSTLVDSDIKEIKAVKGLLTSNKGHIKLKAVAKQLTSAYIMGLPIEQRSILATAVREQMNYVCDLLENTATDDDADEPLFS